MHQNVRFAAIVSGLVFGASCANAADIFVGPYRPTKSLAAGVAAAQAGDRVVLDPGTYLDDTAIVNVPLTIEGAGAGATLSITKPISNGKGILVTNANLTVRNITFQGAQVVDRNGAGIRLQAGAVTVDNSAFVNNQNGILTNSNVGATLAIAGSRFSGNGNGDGYTHGVYANEIGQLTITGSTFAGQKGGHTIKSRALRTTVAQTVIDDGVTGTGSYAIDLSNGGIATIDGVTVTQGSRTTNPIMIAYGSEGNLKATNSLSVRNSGFTNQLQSPSAVAVYNFTTSVSAALVNNVFTGLTSPLKGLGTISSSPIESGPDSMRQASVFSTLQSDAVSFLRFFNTGSSAGTVTINLYDGATGGRLAQWQSPTIAPNAVLQVPLKTVEDAVGVAYKPLLYAVGVVPGIAGTFQHVVWRATGTLSNISNCTTGLTTNAGKLASVHSSSMDGSSPSTVFLYNAAATTASVALGVFDARDGTRLGTYASPPIAPGAQLLVPASALEAAARITPSTAVQYYAVRLESPFTGTVQPVVNNPAGGALSDMTAACPLK